MRDGASIGDPPAMSVHILEIKFVALRGIGAVGYGVDEDGREFAVALDPGLPRTSRRTSIAAAVRSSPSNDPFTRIRIRSGARSHGAGRRQFPPSCRRCSAPPGLSARRARRSAHDPPIGKSEDPAGR